MQVAKIMEISLKIFGFLSDLWPNLAHFSLGMINCPPISQNWPIFANFRPQNYDSYLYTGFFHGEKKKPNSPEF